MTGADLKRARADLLAFSEAINCPLTNKQAASLGLQKRTTVIVGARQVGKSRSLAVLALHRAFRRRGQLVLVVSAGETAAKRLLAEVTSIATRSPLLAGSVLDEQSGLLRLSNDSTIRSAPPTEPAIRGWAADVLICDEAALIPDDVLAGAALPTVAAREHGRVVLAGTPAGPLGVFFEHARMAEEGAEDVELHVWRLADAPWVAGAAIESARRSLAPAQYRREFEAAFEDVAADERVLASEWIRAAQSRELDGDGPAVIGVDVGRGGDESVAIRVAGGVAEVLFAARVPDTMQTAARVWELRGQGSIWVDATGIGYSVVDRLRERGLAVTEYVAGGATSDRRRWANLRSESWWFARQLFEDGKVQIPVDDRVLAAQLGAVKYSLTSSGAILIEDKARMRSSPDRADALIIALWASRQAAGWAAWEKRRTSEWISVDPLIEGGDVGDLMRMRW